MPQAWTPSLRSRPSPPPSARRWCACWSDGRTHPIPSRDELASAIARPVGGGGRPKSRRTRVMNRPHQAGEAGQPERRPGAPTLEPPSPTMAERPARGWRADLMSPSTANKRNRRTPCRRRRDLRGGCKPAPSVCNLVFALRLTAGGKYDRHPAGLATRKRPAERLHFPLDCQTILRSVKRSLRVG